MFCVLCIFALLFFNVNFSVSLSSTTKLLSKCDIKVFMNLTAQSLLLQVWERGLHSQTSAQPPLPPICSFGFLCFYVVAGQERPVDQEVGDLARRSSVTSMESTVSSGTQTTVQDDPEQFEVIKQQKEMIEHGIEL